MTVFSYLCTRFRVNPRSIVFFLTAIWLPDGQLPFVQFRPEGHREPRNEDGSLSPANHLMGLEPGTFRFQLQRFNPLGHSPQV